MNIKKQRCVLCSSVREYIPGLQMYIAYIFMMALLHSAVEVADREAKRPDSGHDGLLQRMVAAAAAGRCRRGKHREGTTAGRRGCPRRAAKIGRVHIRLILMQRMFHHEALQVPLVIVYSN